MTTHTWEDVDRQRSLIAAEVLGVAEYFDKNPDEATDERLAEAFRRYVEQLRKVAIPS